MRILHTADWHVGKTLRGRSRADEHREVLAEIADVARREDADLVLVSGDCFELAAPTPESEQIVYGALLDLARTGAQVVVIAGNHDNERRLRAVEPLLELAGIHARALLVAPESGGVIEVETRGGETARIALVPFVSQRHIVRADDLMDPERHAAEHEQAYSARLSHIIARLTAGITPGTVNLLAGHLMAAGGRLGGGERLAHTVFEYSVSGTAFPPALQYVALGHLHRVQQIPGPCPIWYSGSPLQLDFGETRDEKAVLVVEVAPGRPAEVETVPLTSGRRLRTLAGSLAELDALAGTTGDDYLRVTVRGEARAGLADEVRALFPEAVDVVLEPPEGRAEEPGGRASRRDRPPRELFAEYLHERGASDERVLALFDRLLDECLAAEDTGPTPAPTADTGPAPAAPAAQTTPAASMGEGAG